MKFAIFAIGIVAILVSCSDTAPVKDTTAPKITQEEKVITPNKLLTVEVDGMVCQMGCGSSIRKAVLETGGVASCEFDFEEDRKTNVSTISFDKNAVSADNLVKIISELNDGQFSVGKVKTITISDLSEGNSVTPNDSKEKNTNVAVTSSSGIEIPNLLEIISSYLVH